MIREGSGVILTPREKSVQEEGAGREDGGTERWEPHLGALTRRVNPGSGLVQPRGDISRSQSIGLCTRCSRASSDCEQRDFSEIQARLESPAAAGMGMEITNWSWCCGTFISVLTHCQCEQFPLCQ